MVIVLYVTSSKINYKVVLQGGNILLNKPVYLNKETILGNYESLNSEKEYKYNYGISFWIYLHSSANNIEDKYYNILSYADKPSILFNSKTQMMKIIVNNDDSKIKNNNFEYEGKHIVLQKWTNISIQYNNAVMDVFVNNELVTTKSGIIPYHNLNALKIGEEGGINGGICSVIYFDTPLSSAKRYIHYYTMKNKQPPTIDMDVESILNI